MKKNGPNLLGKPKKRSKRIIALEKRLKRPKRLWRAFTITEFLIVIVIIGILITITAVSYSFIRQSAIVSAIRSDLSSVSSKLKMFQAINDTYPATIDCTKPDSMTNLCIESTKDIIHKYATKNTSTQVFCLASTKDEYRYNINQEGSVMAGPCPMLSLVASNDASYNGVGNTWYDISGNGNNEKINGAAHQPTNGGVFSFDGVNDYVSSNYVAGTESDFITISTWIRPGSTNGTYEISNQGQWGSGSWVGWRFRQIGQTISFSISDGSSQTYECAGGNFESGKWHYVVGVWDGGYIRVYIDGAEVASCSESIDYSGNQGTHSIGKYEGSPYYFNGLIGGIGVYDEALSASEVFENFELTRSFYGV